jgi:hypothetical protein
LYRWHLASRAGDAEQPEARDLRSLRRGRSTDLQLLPRENAWISKYELVGTQGSPTTENVTVIADSFDAPL